MKAMIVIPTYNEKENITRLIPEVLVQDPGSEVLVVDDNSPDGTGSLVEEMSGQNERIHLIRRPGKMGLGTAYITGFRYALERPGIDCIFEMDADFSHQPGYIPDFLKAAESADVVLGSRYVPGGGVRNWGITRKVLSRGGSIFSRFMLGLPARDCTGGFRCYRREVLGALDLDRISSEGFGFQVEMLHECNKRGFRIKEIPIIFPDREQGTSKISKKIVFEAFFLVCRLRFSKQ
ncbi:MAG: dolichyl-phosphate beta-D-mannosyltransferase [Firmicutes bacterium HGW-Firmicutes-14]|nr:MAG: dolichyl-phosphate beta-D-mannosyltransferase [Firmicutes bacterium HGW-Firmicutes-14]